VACSACSPQLQDDKNAAAASQRQEELDEDAAEMRDRRECTRVATLSALFAARDVRESKEFVAADPSE